MTARTVSTAKLTAVEISISADVQLWQGDALAVLSTLPDAHVDALMSGTTGVAAVQEGLGFVGVEHNPVHFGTATRRVDAAIAQGALL